MNEFIDSEVRAETAGIGQSNDHEATADDMETPEKTERVKIHISELGINTEKHSYPKNDEEFFQLFNNGSVPLKKIVDLLKVFPEYAEDLEEKYYTRTAKIDEFFKCYEIVYDAIAAPVTGTQKNQKSQVLEEPTDNSFDIKKYFYMNREHAEPYSGIQLGITKLYEMSPITIGNDFRIKIKSSDTIDAEMFDLDNIVLADRDIQELCFVAHCEKSDKYNVIVADVDDIIFDKFKGKKDFNLLLTDKQHSGRFWYAKCSIQMEQAKETDSVLCIDFGTSNTTAGSYHIKNQFSDEPEIVQFTDATDENHGRLGYCPTVVFVEDCSGDKVKYSFGFEAKRLERLYNYETNASVFYELKHWLEEDDSSEKIIEIIDPNGNVKKVNKVDIVKAYLEYIIHQSEFFFGVRFRELHFTAPVKMKTKFIAVLKDMFENNSSRHFIVNEGMDEATAIMYDYILSEYEKWQSSAGENSNPPSITKSIVVFDCGGGTTDLSVCDYTISPCELYKGKITVRTRFSNGDFNYGGNTITYRIMQLLKIKIAMGLGAENLAERFDKIMKISENEILEQVDNGCDLLIDEMERLYEECELIIPTKWKEAKWDSDIPKRKRNFYYLWQFAEQVKILFYREEKEVQRENWDDAIESIGDLKQMHLYRQEDDDLVIEEEPFKNLQVTITEIRKMIYGDIYSLLKRILPDDGSNVYDYYHLSGQSCKINLFTDLLKEFIPGRKLRNRISSLAGDSLTLKKRCIFGSIRYMLSMRTKEKVITSYESDKPKSIYEISLGTGDIQSLWSDRSFCGYPIKKDLTEIVLSVYTKPLGNTPADSNNKARHIRTIRFTAWTGDNWSKAIPLETMLNKITEDNSIKEKLRGLIKDNAKENVKYIIAIPSSEADGYGFDVVVFMKTKNGDTEEYTYYPRVYYNYEETLFSFFDGLR